MSADPSRDSDAHPAVLPPPMTRREAREREAAARAATETASAQRPAEPAEPAEPTARPAAPTAEPRPTAPVQRAEPAAPPHAEPPTPAETPHGSEFHHWLSAAGHGDDERPPRGPKPPRSGRGGRRAVAWIVATLVIIGLVGGGGLFAWDTFQPQVKAIMNKIHPAPTDWPGNGSGTVDVTIKQGDTGSTVAATLAHAGVTRTPQAFYNLLLHTAPEPVFQPGVYRLRSHMSAASALAMLQSPSSKIARTLLVREGDTEKTVLANAASATGIPLAQLQAAAKNPASFGLPAQAKSLEGFLYPATYTFDPGTTAQQLLTTLVSRAKQQFAALGVPSTSLWNTVILASIVQKEAGPNPADLPKIAGVFDNRLRAGMLLQSDATVAYGAGLTGTVWTTNKQRADAGNPYNTYVHKGLPPGPISNPGSEALQAALHPQGDYLFFTAVNLKTGETAFSTTQAQQDANVAKLQAWCREPGNASYCQ